MNINSTGHIITQIKLDSDLNTNEVLYCVTIKGPGLRLKFNFNKKPDLQIGDSVDITGEIFKTN